MPHYPQYIFCVGHDVSPVIVQHSCTLKVFIPRAHLIHCLNFETDFAWEVGLDLLQRWSLSGAVEIIHVYLNEYVQLVNLLHRICRNFAVQVVLPWSIPSVFRRVSDRARTIATHDSQCWGGTFENVDAFFQFEQASRASSGELDRSQPRVLREQHHGRECHAGEPLRHGLDAWNGGERPRLEADSFTVDQEAVSTLEATIHQLLWSTD